MKKITLLICTVMITGSLFAQKNLQLSFSTGPSINWMSAGENEISAGNVKAGYDFGVVADVFFDDLQRYALTTGFLLSNTGGELDYNNADPFEFAGETINAGSTIRYRLQYLEVPMAVKLKTSQFKRWTIWGQFGLSAFANVRAKGDTSDGVLDKSDIQNEIRLFNLAMNLGLGADFDLGSGNALTLGIIFKDGLTDVTKEHYSDGKTTVNSLVFKLGLIF
ncbi:MAG: porin family protein [Prolixibacteraceae bacterium]